MAKYILQLRRGVKETQPDGTVTRNDWEKYTEEKPNESIPRAGELVLEYDNGIPRLKIGNGVDTFAKLPYMSVDSFVLPTPASITLYANRWERAADNRYYQVVKVHNATVTTNSKVDLQPNSEQLVVFHEKDLAFVTENEDGIISVFCVGQVPQNDYTIQATITEITEVTTNG